jgi:PAS domain S-box-containing protein
MISILVVEDERIVALALDKALRSMGYVVTGFADSGEEAVAKATQSHPDIVLMDIRLKGKMDGIEAADKIQKHLDIPVVYLTAYGDEQILQRATSTAPYGYVLKPFEERDVHIALEMALYKHLTERELKDRQRWLMATLRSIGDAVIVTDEMVMVRLINPAAERVTGWSEQEAMGKSLLELAPMEDEAGNPLTGEMIKRAFGQGVAVPIAGALLVRRSGPRLKVEGSLAPVQDDRRRWLGLVAVLRDVSERETIKLTLHQSEERYRLAFQASPHPIALLDLDGKVLQCNQAMADLLGVGCETIMRQRLAELQILAPQQKKQLSRALLRAAQGLSSAPLHIKQGELVWEVLPVVLKQDGAPDALQLIAREVSSS